MPLLKSVAPDLSMPRAVSPYFGAYKFCHPERSPQAQSKDQLPVMTEGKELS
jgi:hypothetical protein